MKTRKTTALVKLECRKYRKWKIEVPQIEFLYLIDFRCKKSELSEKIEFCSISPGKKNRAAEKRNEVEIVFSAEIVNAFSLVLYLQSYRDRWHIKKSFLFRWPQWRLEPWIDPGWQRRFRLGWRLVRWGRRIRRWLHHSQTLANLGRKWRWVQKSSIKVKKIRETEFLLFWRIFLGPEDGPVFHGQVCTKGQPIRLCLGQMMNLRKKQLIKSKHCLKKSIIVSTKMDLTKMAMMTLMRMSVQEHPILLVQSIHVFQKKWRVNVPFGDKGFHIWGKKTRQIESDQLYFTEKSWFF